MAIDDITNGLQIFKKYNATDLAAEHDIIYVGGGESDQISIEDKKTLDEYCWRWDQELTTWFRYV